MKVNRPVIVCDACDKEITDDMSWYTVTVHCRKGFMDAVNDGAELDICSPECLAKVKDLRKAQPVFALSASYMVTASYLSNKSWGNW